MKYLSWKIKYNYVMRYINGEATFFLAKEIIEKQQSKSNKIESQKQLIKLRDKKLTNEGIEGIIGLNKKKNHYEDQKSKKENYRMLVF